MLTSYLVKCPHSDCNWFGSLLPQGQADPWRGAVPEASVVVFRCPQCQKQWQGRISGEDVEPLPLQDMALPGA